MEKAFTMIELIFVIVVIGILAIIAIPKLSATRDDAEVVMEVNNLTNCINDIVASYTASSKENNNSSSCKHINCANVILGNLYDGNITVTLLDSSNGKPQYCDYSKKLSIKKHLEGNHSFGGKKIILN